MEMVTPNFNTSGRTPLYHQLYEYLKNEIRRGTISPGTRLPSKRKLAVHLGISQNTVQAAYFQLQEEGYLYSRERSGFFVCQLDLLHRIAPEMAAEAAETVAPVEYRRYYDFSYHGVDRENFPFSSWKKAVRESLQPEDPDLFRQGHYQGYLPLRRAICRYLHHSRGVRSTPEQIVISAGTELLLQNLIQLFGPQGVYGLENPGYERLAQIFRAANARYTGISQDAGGMRPDLVENSEANILCVTPSHQFPTGNIMPVSRRIRLLNWANSREDRYIVEDDYDSEFKYSGLPVPALQSLDQSGKVIYMGTFSKSLSPALRLSYMVLPAELLRRYQKNFSFLMCPVPTQVQKAMEFFMESGDFERHLNRMRILYRKKREELVKVIEEWSKKIRIPGLLEIQGAEAGLHLVLQVQMDEDEDALVARAEEAGVRVYGLSRYQIGASVTGPPRIILGYASLPLAEIRPAAETLMAAWFSEYIFTRTID